MWDLFDSTFFYVEELTANYIHYRTYVKQFDLVSSVGVEFRNNPDAGTTSVPKWREYQQPDPDRSPSVVEKHYTPLAGP